jgi:MFS transporter, DHA1 family, multidrug resistance protein
MTIALAIIRDLFEGATARTKFSQIALATMTVPTLAPTAGAALLDIGGWRAIHTVLAAIGALLLLAMLLGLPKARPWTRRPGSHRTLLPATTCVC